MHRLADADQLKLTPPFEKVTLFHSLLQTIQNLQSMSMIITHMGQNTLLYFSTFEPIEGSTDELLKKLFLRNDK
jgi:hypothetical protein